MSKIVVNPLLDAICYLSMRANGESFGTYITDYYQKYPNDIPQIDRLTEPFLRLEHKLNTELTFDDDKLHFYFDRFGGVCVPLSPWGTNAGCIFSQLAVCVPFQTVEEAYEALSKKTSCERMTLILNSVNAPIKYTEEIADENEFFTAIEKLPIPQNDKWKLNKAYYRFDAYLDELVPMLSPVTRIIRNCFNPEFGFDFDAYNESPARQRIAKLASDVMPWTPTLDSIHIYVSCMLLHRIATCINNLDSNKAQLENNPVYANIGLLGFSLKAISSSMSPSKRLVPPLKALADQSRFDILCCLAEREMYGRELAEKLSLTPPTISQHISKLLNEGLITAHMKAKFIYYSLNKERLSDVLEGINGCLLSPTPQSDPPQNEISV